MSCPRPHPDGLVAQVEPFVLYHFESPTVMNSLFPFATSTINFLFLFSICYLLVVVFLRAFLLPLQIFYGKFFEHIFLTATN